MKNQQGVTLLEVLLVLVIGGMIILLSLQQYNSWRTRTFALAVHEQADAMFQAMTAYYRANCSSSQGGALSEAKLRPLEDHKNVAVDIEKILQKGGYLLEKIPPNPIVSSVEDEGTEGFVAQYNLVWPLPARRICTAGKTYPSGLIDTTSCTQTENSPKIGKIVIWVEQVAVHLNAKTKAQAEAFQNLLGADCLSSYDEDKNIVRPCHTDPDGGLYAVWERAPTAANPQAASSYWVTMPVVNQFKQQYTTSPVETLVGGSAPTQYFECGD